MGALYTVVGSVIVAIVTTGGAVFLGRRKESPPPTPPPDKQGIEVESRWLTWMQSRQSTLESDLLAAQQVAASAVNKAQEMDKEIERLKQTETDRRERFLRSGLDPDTGAPLSRP